MTLNNETVTSLAEKNNDAWKSYDDIPDDKRDNYVPLPDGGYVLRSAKETLDQEILYVKNHGPIRSVINGIKNFIGTRWDATADAVNLLHERAKEEDELRELGKRERDVLHPSRIESIQRLLSQPDAILSVMSNPQLRDNLYIEVLDSLVTAEGKDPYSPDRISRRQFNSQGPKPFEITPVRQDTYLKILEESGSVFTTTYDDRYSYPQEVRMVVLTSDGFKVLGKKNTAAAEYKAEDTLGVLLVVSSWMVDEYGDTVCYGRIVQFVPNTEKLNQEIGNSRNTPYGKL